MITFSIEDADAIGLLNTIKTLPVQPSILDVLAEQFDAQYVEPVVEEPVVEEPVVEEPVVEEPVVEEPVVEPKKAKK